LDEWIEAKRLAEGTPGLSLAIVDRGEVVYEQAFGHANLESRAPLTPDHWFETGSIGKSFTAIALLQLQEEGKIDLDAPVNDYLPWFAVQTDFEPIRLRHLMSHTAGISSGIDFAPDARIQVWAMRETWTTTPPGAHFHYSNVGYKVLGVVLERVAGAPYRETIQVRVLDRLGLKDSAPTITNTIRPKMAVAHTPAFDDRPWWPGQPLAPATWFETDTADGCLAMTAADLARYLAALLNLGEGLISSESFEQLIGKNFEFEPEPEPHWYGLGIMGALVDGHRYIGHSGGMVGYSSRMIGDLETGLGVVALVNGPGAPSLIARTALDFLRAEAEGRPFEFPATTDRVRVENAADFHGRYQTPGGRKTIEIAASGAALSLEVDGDSIPLHRLGGDAFVADAPGWNLFPLAFERRDGPVTAVAHGGDWLVRNDVEPENVQSLPAEWAPFPGHYRSHNPWLTSFKVVERKGRLWLITPTLSDGFEGAEPLVPARNGWFRLGEDELGPEFIRFDTIVDGAALQATLSIGPFYRAES
jgi:CubicO group peptidase (beta-lactamase class C family)